MSTLVLVAWGIAGAGLGGYAARLKARSVGVGIVLGAVLGPFASLLLLARKASPEEHDRVDSPAEAGVGCLALAVLVALVLGVIFVIAAGRSGVRLGP